MLLQNLATYCKAGTLLNICDIFGIKWISFFLGFISVPIPFPYTWYMSIATLAI